MRTLSCALALILSVTTAFSKDAGLKFKTWDGKKVTLHDWTLDGDSLRGTREVWIDYEKVTVRAAFALNEVILPADDSLRAAQARLPEYVPTVPPRSLLRLDLDGSRAEGSLLRASPDSIWLDTLGYARSSIRRIQVHSGQMRATGTGLTVGACIGLVAGLALLPAAATSAADNGVPDDGGSIVIVPFITIGMGALLGVLVGSLFKKDKWVVTTATIPSDRETSAPSGPRNAGSSP